MSQTVIPPDLRLWVCDYLRLHLGDVPGIQIDVSEPTEYKGDHPLVIVSDIPGAMVGQVTYDWTLAITTRMGTRQDDRPCRDLCARIKGILTADPDVLIADGSPIASIVNNAGTGPTFVTEDHDTARYYTTIDYTVAGEIR